ncbi:MAG: hypothetical protein BHW64_05645 [Candidatus Melainabacteria bacterium LEY3_CP_29_8]|nr:MAG: hypothetical protein BHW64_05645 [Candidatus Melainabacteria bacterium LEY3_CP_29_8]
MYTKLKNIIISLTTPKTTLPLKELLATKTALEDYKADLSFDHKLEIVKEVVNLINAADMTAMYSSDLEHLKLIATNVKSKKELIKIMEENLSLEIWLKNA